jgi:hypothetical protein
MISESQTVGVHRLYGVAGLNIGHVFESLVMNEDLLL